MYMVDFIDFSLLWIKTNKIEIPRCPLIKEPPRITCIWYKEFYVFYVFLNVFYVFFYIFNPNKKIIFPPQKKIYL